MMKDLIKEFLNDTPITVYTGNQTKRTSKKKQTKTYDKGDIFPQDKTPKVNSRTEPLSRDRYGTSAQHKNANVSLAGREEADNQLDLKDVSKFFADISYHSFGKLSSSKISMGLKTIRNLISDFGTPEDKITWDNTIYLLLNNNENFKKAYENSPDAAFFDPPRMSNRSDSVISFEAAENNWTIFKTHPGISLDTLGAAVSTTTTAVAQRKRDIFNIDMRNYGSEVGQFPSEVNAAIKTLFSGVNTVPERLKKLTQFTEEMSSLVAKDSSELFESMSLKKLLASTMIADYLNSVIEDMDTGASAYLFESFLAAIFGGTVEGKSKTDEGKMGGVDFTMAGGASGSAKLYSRYGGISQAVGGFNALEPIFYVVGLKTKAANDAITSIRLHHYILYIDPEENVKGKPGHHRKGPKATSGPLLPDGKRWVLDKDGKPKVKLSAGHYIVVAPSGIQLGKAERIPKDGKILLNKTSYYKNETSMGSFNLLRFSDNTSKSFKEAISRKGKKVTDDFNQAIAGITEIQTQSNLMSKNLNTYSVTGEGKSGSAALENLGEIETWTKLFFEFFKDIEGYESVEDPGDTATSSKITEAMIKNIIKKTLESKNA